MSKGRHHWKGAAKRNEYAFILSPKMGWVRVFRFGKKHLGVSPL
jgi:hypothetical protein